MSISCNLGHHMSTSSQKLQLHAYQAFAWDNLVKLPFFKSLKVKINSFCTIKSQYIHIMKKSFINIKRYKWKITFTDYKSSVN